MLWHATLYEAILVFSGPTVRNLPGLIQKMPGEGTVKAASNVEARVITSALGLGFPVTTIASYSKAHQGPLGNVSAAP